MRVYSHVSTLSSRSFIRWYILCKMVLCSAPATPATNYDILTFLWSVYFLCKPLYCKPCRRSYCLPWKRVRKFHRRRLQYTLVQCCRHRHGQRPCQLNCSCFPLPRCTEYCRWRRRKIVARACHNQRQKVQHELFFTPSIYPHFHIKKEVYKSTLASFCDGSQDFLSLPRLMPMS